MANTKKTILDTGNNIIKYMNKLTPPEGYSLSFAVGTSFSLDLKAFGQAILALDNAKSNFDESSLLSIHNAIDRLSEKVILFHDAGAVNSKSLDNEILPLLDVLLYPVKNPCGAFHPKIWVIRFKCDANPQKEKFRLLVLSRNMSFDKCLDLIYTMEGKLDETKNSELKNQPLCELLDYLLKIPDIEKSKVIQIEELKELLKHVVFSTNEAEEFDDFDFIFTTPDKKQLIKSSLYTDTYDEMLIMSPFLKEDVVLNFLTHANKTKIITREDALKELVKPIKEKASKDIIVFIMNNKYIGENFREYDIHAKLFVTRKGENQNLYMGSANATHGAFNNNVEFLIRLHCKSNIIDPLWKDLENGKLFEKFEDFEKISVESTEERKEKEAADELFRKLSKLDAKAEAGIDINDLVTIKIEFTITDDFKKDAEGYTITVRPSIDGEAKQLDSNMRYSNIKLNEFSNLYSVTICKSENSSPLKEGMLNIRTVVDETIRLKRDEAIFNSVFNVESLCEYLRRGEKNGTDLITREISEMGKNQDTPYPSLPILDQPFEIMLKYASEDKMEKCSNFARLDKTSKLYNLFEDALETIRS